MQFLLDTNVVSEPWKRTPNASVLRFLRAYPKEDLFISSVSIAELHFGAHTVLDVNKKAHLFGWIANEIRPLFGNRVLEVTELVLVPWLLLVEAGKRINRTFSQPDLFLAAMALHHDMILLTRNVKHFADVPDLQLLDPWETRS